MLVDPYPALLFQKLLDVIGPTGTAARRATCFPTTEWIDTWPRAGCRASLPVGVDHAGLDLVEEIGDFILIAAENASR